MQGRIKQDVRVRRCTSARFFELDRSFAFELLHEMDAGFPQVLSAEADEGGRRNIQYKPSLDENFLLYGPEYTRCQPKFCQDINFTEEHSPSLPLFRARLARRRRVCANADVQRSEGMFGAGDGDDTWRDIYECTYSIALKRCEVVNRLAKDPYRNYADGRGVSPLCIFFVIFIGWV